MVAGVGMKRPPLQFLRFTNSHIKLNMKLNLHHDLVNILYKGQDRRFRDSGSDRLGREEETAVRMWWEGNGGEKSV